ncbi:MAG: hypothetical protein KKA67_05140 [Spirochaetes bacterium]|nr:hypothetical protein [Spirochaetota bacterium]MBU1081390.1 hypothetical protein [Spirochaetota bacterium]
MKRLSVAILLTLASASSPLIAQTVEVALLESGGGTGTALSSERVIDGAMDGLFLEGFIATSSRPSPGDAESLAAFVPDPGAEEGMVDYVIVILAEYTAASPIPACSYRLVRVRDRAELARGSHPAQVPASLSDKDIKKACSNAGSAISASCGGVMRGLGASRRVYEYEEA